MLSEGKTVYDRILEVLQAGMALRSSPDSSRSSSILRVSGNTAVLFRQTGHGFGNVDPDAIGIVPRW